MAELNVLRDRHVKISESQIMDLINKHMDYMNRSVRVQHKLINESQAKVEDLRSQLNTMKESVCSAITDLEQKGAEFTKRKDQVDQLEVQRNKFIEEIHALKLKRNSLKSTKPSSHDEQILENGRKKLKLYKELTGIKWDYWNLEEHIAGYVGNRNDYIKHFSYKNEKTEQLINNLWQEISNATKSGKGISDKESCKENIDTNK